MQEFYIFESRDTIMRKSILLCIGFILFILFVLIDQSGVGYKQQIGKIKEWANGKGSLKDVFHKSQK